MGEWEDDCQRMEGFVVCGWEDSVCYCGLGVGWGMLFV